MQKVIVKHELLNNKAKVIITPNFKIRLTSNNTAADFVDVVVHYFVFGDQNKPFLISKSSETTGKRPIRKRT